MSTINRRLPKSSGFFLAAVLITFICLEPLLGTVRSAVAAQKSTAELPSRNKNKAKPAGDAESPIKNENKNLPGNQPSGEDAPTRPRRADTSRGPIIRVALMTDVSAVVIGSQSGLTVRHAAETSDSQSVSSGQVRIELRQQTVARKQAEQARITTYTIEVSSTSDLRKARKISDDLKKRFTEPVQTTYNGDTEEYRVLIGRFSNRSDAARMLDRLRLAGYSSTRTVQEEAATDRAATRPLAGAVTQMVVFDAGQMIASSDDVLIIAPGIEGSSDSEGRADGEAQKVLAVRVNNKDYRGQIHLVLNSRGRINVVNAVALEDYLRGVVPLELSPGLYPHIEALKAQAVAARTYAIERRGQFDKEGYDLVDDARSQVYGGLSAESELSNRAVEETRGMVAVYINEYGKAEPIEALYTSTCGGRTENNEEVFGGKPVPYLRSVACSPDRQTFAGRDIISSRKAEPVINQDGRSITREVALAEVFGFSLPRRMTEDYISQPPGQDELVSWLESAAVAARTDKPQVTGGNLTRLAAFASAVVRAVYGEGRAAFLLSPADVDYLLGGFGAESIPREARADVALLLKTGAMRLPADGSLKASALVTRGFAIETLARAVYIKSQTSTVATPIANLKTQIAQASEGGRLLVASATATPKTQSAPREPRYTTVNAVNSSTKRSSSNASRNNSVREVVTQEITPEQTRSKEAAGIEIENKARLFRVIGGESYAVDRLTLAGGERVTYHLNSAGEVDFLEAAVSERSLASDQNSSVAEWRERITTDELMSRLARSRVSVGRIVDLSIVSLSSSSRVSELEVIGDTGRAELRGSHIRNSLGLKENLFVIDRERDGQGRVTAFVFTGRGWGHGVGMCQTGAAGLAKEGYSYTAILEKYYTGIKLQKMY